jgi:hypothetical protein
VGWGFNLETGASKPLIEAVGANYADICAGRAQLTPAQAEALFRQKFAQAQVGIDPALPPEAQSVLIELHYWLGLAGTSKFIHMLAAINKRDFATAAFELLNSKLPKTDLIRSAHLAIRLARADINV